MILVSFKNGNTDRAARVKAHFIIYKHAVGHKIVLPPQMVKWHLHIKNGLHGVMNIYVYDKLCHQIEE